MAAASPSQALPGPLASWVRLSGGLGACHASPLLGLALPMRHAALGVAALGLGAAGTLWHTLSSDTGAASASTSCAPAAACTAATGDIPRPRGIVRRHTEMHCYLSSLLQALASSASFVAHVCEVHRVARALLPRAERDASDECRLVRMLAKCLRQLHDEQKRHREALVLTGLVRLLKKRMGSPIVRMEDAHEALLVLVDCVDGVEKRTAAMQRAGAGSLGLACGFEAASTERRLFVARDAGRSVLGGSEVSTLRCEACGALGAVRVERFTNLEGVLDIVDGDEAAMGECLARYALPTRVHAACRCSKTATRHTAQLFVGGRLPRLLIVLVPRYRVVDPVRGALRKRSTRIVAPPLLDDATLRAHLPPCFAARGVAACAMAKGCATAEPAVAAPRTSPRAVASYESKEPVPSDASDASEPSDDVGEGCDVQGALQPPSSAAQRAPFEQWRWRGAGEAKAARGGPLHPKHAAPSGYALRSVVVHNGASACSGHYTTLRRRGEKWWQCNDASVVEVDAEAAQRCEAYLLCYERI